MKIKQIEKNELQSKCVDLIAKSHLELRQKTDAETMVAFAQILAEDLIDYYGTLDFEDIVQAFKQGVRNTDDFLLNAKTYTKWIKAHRQIIWNNEGKPASRIDKRLHYKFKNQKLIS
jgi:hypothetical protein